MYRTHSTLFRFLHDVLGVPVETADADACRLEHGLSDTTLGRLTEFLKAAAAPAANDAPRRTP